MRQLKIINKTTFRNENIDRYFNELRLYPQLTKDEEEELTFLYKETQNPKILETLAKANLKFVVSVAKQYANEENLSELISEGNIGLIKAIQRFDPSRGLKLISYAVWWIRQAILEYLSTKAENIRLPLNINTGRRKVLKFIQEFYAKNTREPLFDEMLEGIDIEVNVLKNVLYAMKINTISYDTPFDINDDNSLVDILSSNETLDFTKNNDKKKEVEFFINKLKTYREKYVLLNYFGINDKHREKSLTEIAEDLDLTRERIRQIKEKSLKKLRKYKNLNI